MSSFSCISLKDSHARHHGNCSQSEVINVTPGAPVPQH